MARGDIAQLVRIEAQVEQAVRDAPDPRRASPSPA
jgi:hypothetical protein